VTLNLGTVATFGVVVLVLLAVWFWLALKGD
jgi:hypothetical protein